MHAYADQLAEVLSFGRMGKKNAFESVNGGSFWRGRTRHLWLEQLHGGHDLGVVLQKMHLFAQNC